MAAPALFGLLGAKVAASGFVPTDISGCQAWYDASDAGSFTFSSGSDVSQWNDLSGNGRHLTQSTSAQQPHRSGTINGLDSVVFGASDTEHMSVSYTLAQPLTIFAVVKRVGNGGGNEQIVGNVSSPSATLLATGSGGAWGYFAGSLPTAGTPNGNTHLLCGIFNNSGTSRLLLDGSSLTTSTPGSAGINGTLRLGSDNTSNRWNGHIAEVIVYDSALGTSDREAVEDYLIAKWGI